MRPGAAEIAPQVEALDAANRRLELVPQRFEQGAGDLRLDLVLHGDVGAERLAILRAQPAAPGLGEASVQLRQLGRGVGDGDSITI